MHRVDQPSGAARAGAVSLLRPSGGAWETHCCRFVCEKAQGSALIGQKEGYLYSDGWYS
jgi:hypothetical protein